MNITTEVSGQKRIAVQESTALPALRRQALREACGLASDGSLAEWRKLSSAQREAASPRLAALVTEHREELERSEQMVTHDSGWSPNLLLDAGMDWVCGNATSIDFFSSAHLGTGTTPTVYDSEAITATASGTAATASGPFFTAPMAGMVIRWDSGAEAYISSVTDSEHAVLASSTTASGAFAVHAVNRTGLANLVATQTSKTNDSLTRASGTTTRTMSWVFALETVAHNYTEGAIRATHGGAFLSLFLLTGGTVTVEIGQQAKLYYAFSAAVNTGVVTEAWPTGSYDASAPGGWDNVTGQHQVVSLRSLDGREAYHGATLLPSIDSGSDRGVLTTTSSLLGYGDNSSADVPTPIGSYVNGSLAAYTPGTFYRDSSYYFSASHSDTTAIRSFMIYEYYGNVAWQYLFDSAKTKDGNHSITLVIRRSLRRVLVNP